tara:strand:+ start:239 stop:1288 length:1050 start_codon:yes stop_codon:yes gene_type:complete
MSSNLKKVIWAVLILGLIGMGAFAYYVYSSVFVSNTSFENEEAHLYIASDASFSDVMEDLRPLLKDDLSFEAVANRKKYPQNIKSGHFIIKKGMNNNDIVNTIRSKNVPVLVKFNNQERLEDLAGHLSQQLEPDSIAFLNAFQDSMFLKQSGFNPQTALGMYIPNSYEVYWNTSAAGFRDKMLKEYNAFWNKNRNSKAQEINLSRDQVIALAAIVQKETAKVDERPRVAGVYLNRIKAGMPLQADPTIIFAKKLAENDFGQVIKRVLYRDLELDSPYNTYKNTGVPPGPISMPDISSIDAVLNAEQHDYYYFVANVQNFGYHKFAKTLAQHNRNKAEYVRWVNQNGVRR